MKAAAACVCVSGLFICQAGVSSRKCSLMLKILKQDSFLCIQPLCATPSAHPNKINRVLPFCMEAGRKGLVGIRDQFSCKWMRKENCLMLLEDFHFAQVFAPWPSPRHLIAIHFVVCGAALTSV